MQSDRDTILQLTLQRPQAHIQMMPAEPMEVDKAPMGRTLRKRKGKVAKHLKRKANEKEMKNFQKRVFKIPLVKPFEEAYFTHRLWMFFRDTRDTEEDIRRMFCEAREKIKNRITLKKKSDPGKFAVPYHLGLKVEPSKESFTFVYFSQRSSGGIIRDLEVQIGNVLVPVDFHVFDIKLNWNSSLLLGTAFLSTVGEMCNILFGDGQNAHRHIDDSAHEKSIDSPKEESADNSPEDWENDYYNPIMATHTMHTEEYDEDYEEERAVEYIAIIDEEDRLLHHSYLKRNATSINRAVSPSIDTHPHQTNRKRASTDIAYYRSIDTEVDHVREGDYSIGSWADDHHHESYAVETTVHEPGADEIHEGFIYEEVLNMQRRDETDQHQEETCWERTRFSHPCSRVNRPSIDDQHPSSIDIRPKQPSTVSAKNQYDNQYLTQDEFSIFRDPDGYARAIDGHALQKVTNEFYDTAGGIDNRLKQKYRHPTRPSIDVDVLSSIDRHPKFGKRAYDRDGTGDSTWKRKMSMESTEMIRDMPEM
ncbi:hypothetical protein F2Q69_00007154 [Brassica cretica]|uniref:Uncharacterized protein n=1 Tax=Brassica cretica TaxID=69181 RepID=A0A8S9P3D9_BRACR|nr:hypothetical protein F2Q69_00007154 [Brassica cretica]